MIVLKVIGITAFVLTWALIGYRIFLECPLDDIQDDEYEEMIFNGKQ